MITGGNKCIDMSMFISPDKCRVRITGWGVKSDIISTYFHQQYLAHLQYKRLFSKEINNIGKYIGNTILQGRSINYLSIVVT